MICPYKYLRPTGSFGKDIDRGPGGPMGGTGHSHGLLTEPR